MNNLDYKKDNVRFKKFILLIFFLYTILLNFLGYFEIGLLSDDYLNFISAQNSTLLQKFTSSIPYYSNLHFRPLWFFSINFSIWINNLLEISKDNFILFRIENLIYFYILIFLSSYLLFKLTKSPTLAFIFSLVCLLFPNNVINICWTVGKVDLLCGIFMFCALIFTFSYAEEKTLSKLIAVIFFFFLALLTKEPSIILPFTTILLIIICYGKKRIAYVKALFLLEFLLLLFYSAYKIFFIGNTPHEIISTYQNLNILNVPGVILRAFLSIFIPFDYLSIQYNLLNINFIFILYLVLISVLFILIILMIIKNKFGKFLFLLTLIFLTSITPNIVAGYFRPQLALIPFMIFSFSLFLIIEKIKNLALINFMFIKIILFVIILFWGALSYSLIQDWKYASNYSVHKITQLIDLNLNNERKNIILALPSRLRQSFMLNYTVGSYNYWKYKKFELKDKIFDLVHVGALNTNSLNSELIVSQINNYEYEVKTSGNTQYFLRVDSFDEMYKDKDIEIVITDRNIFDKATKMKIKILSGIIDVYLLNGNKFC